MSNEREQIVAAAVRDKHGNVTTEPPPKRHKDLVQQLPSGLYATGEQGFVTSGGRFVGRIEAAALAIRAGQIKELRWPPELYTEDLW